MDQRHDERGSAVGTGYVLMPLSPQKLKSDFPIFDGSDLVYLDNASTTQKPKEVLNAMHSMYVESNANVHRALYDIGSKATERFENARHKVSTFINAPSEKEIIFTSGTTESINLLCRTLVNSLKPGEEILLSEMEHHANLVPWQMACDRTGAKLKFIPLNERGELDLSNPCLLYTSDAADE